MNTSNNNLDISSTPADLHQKAMQELFQDVQNQKIYFEWEWLRYGDLSTEDKMKYKDMKRQDDNFARLAAEKWLETEECVNDLLDN